MKYKGRQGNSYLLGNYGEFVRITEYKPYKFGWWNTGLAFLSYYLSIPFIVFGITYVFTGYL